jgi:hypothetical protein
MRERLRSGSISAGMTRCSTTKCRKGLKKGDGALLKELWRKEAHLLFSNPPKAGEFYFGNFESAARFCCTFDELRTYFRSRHSMGETISLTEQRQLFCERLAALQLLMRMAS